MGRYRPAAQLIFINANILWNSSVKYLGLTLGKRPTWQPHISPKLQQAYQRLSMLYPILNKKIFNTETMLSSYMRTNFNYTTHLCVRPAREKCMTSHISKIQLFQNKVLRIITNAPRNR